MSDGPERSPEEERGHAPEGVSVRFVWWSLIALLGILAVSAGLIAGLTAWLEAERPVPGPTQRAQIEQRRAPGSPGPFDDLRELRRELEAEQRRRLNRVGWIDREQNLARVPIGYAKQHILEHGLPEFEGTASPAGAGSQTQEGGAR